MTLSARVLPVLLLAGACTTSTQEVNRDTADTAPGPADSDLIIDTGETDPYLSDTGRPGAEFTSSRFKITALALAPPACTDCKEDVDGDGDVENKISELLNSADILFPGGFAVADVNPRVATLLETELVIVLMSLDQQGIVLDVGVAQGERDTDGALQPKDGEVDGTGQPVQALTGTFTERQPATGALAFQTPRQGGDITVPFQFDDDEPVLLFTLKGAAIRKAAWAPARGDNPERIEGRLMGSFSTTEVLEGTIFPLINDYDLWDDTEKENFRNIARDLVNAGADIDVDTTDPKISGVFRFTAEAEDW